MRRRTLWPATVSYTGKYVVSSDFRTWPIVLQKSFGGGDGYFSGPPMLVARADMRDHVVSSENDHRASHRRYGVLQCWSRLEINICEIFGDVRFSTFATLSALSRHVGPC